MSNENAVKRHHKLTWRGVVNGIMLVVMAFALVVCGKRFVSNLSVLDDMKIMQNTVMMVSDFVIDSVNIGSNTLSIHPTVRNDLKFEIGTEHINEYSVGDTVEALFFDEETPWKIKAEVETKIDYLFIYAIMSLVAGLAVVVSLLDILGARHTAKVELENLQVELEMLQEDFESGNIDEKSYLEIKNEILSDMEEYK